MSEKFFSIDDLRKAYMRKENITKLLSLQGGLDREEVIEIAYDIQSGSYIEDAISSPERLKRYAKEIHELSSKFIFDQDVILDCGAGELTTISALSQHLPGLTRLLACDISLSRLRVGRRFAERCMRSDLAQNLELFVADMACMPLADSSVDVVFTSHALEPNHGREAALLRELLRISRRHLILFEPSWENATKAIRSRMDEHGYVRDLPRHIKEAGGRLISVEPLPNPLNPMNPTYCYVVEVIDQCIRVKNEIQGFQCPRSGFPLQKYSNYWWSIESGWAYPEIEGVSCLRTKHGLLMSHG